jgi:hypothetical protein
MSALKWHKQSRDSGGGWWAQERNSYFRIVKGNDRRYYLTERVGVFGDIFALGAFEKIDDAKAAAANVHAPVSNPGRTRHSLKWDHCVAEVRSKGSAKSPEAVCTKSLGSRAYNPRDPEMSRAAKLYESFRERPPKRVNRIGFAPPRIVVDIGHVEFIGYRTTHGKKLTLYRHDFAPGSRPLLCVSPDGRQLMLIGGRYKFTERGIVDRDIDDREIENPNHGKPI